MAPSPSNVVFPAATATATATATTATATATTNTTATARPPFSSTLHQHWHIATQLIHAHIQHATPRAPDQTTQRTLIAHPSSTQHPHVLAHIHALDLARQSFVAPLTRGRRRATPLVGSAAALGQDERLKRLLTTRGGLLET